MRLAAALTGEKRAGAFLLQRLSLAVQRGNCASVFGTIPSGADFEELFFFSFFFSLLVLLGFSYFL